MEYTRQVNEVILFPAVSDIKHIIKTTYNFMFPIVSHVCFRLASVSMDSLDELTQPSHQ